MLAAPQQLLPQALPAQCCCTRAANACRWLLQQPLQPAARGVSGSAAAMRSSTRSGCDDTRNNGGPLLLCCCSRRSSPGCRQSPIGWLLSRALPRPPAPAAAGAPSSSRPGAARRCSSQCSSRHSSVGTIRASRVCERHSMTDADASSWPEPLMAPPTVLASLCHHSHAPPPLPLPLLLLLALQLCSTVCTSARGVEQHEAAALLQLVLIATCSTSACISHWLLLSAASAALPAPHPALAACSDAPRCSDAALLSPGLGVDLLLCRRLAAGGCCGCRCMLAAAPAWYTRRALSVFCTSGHRPFLMPRLASLEDEAAMVKTNRQSA